MPDTIPEGAHTGCLSLCCDPGECLDYYICKSTGMLMVYDPCNNLIGVTPDGITFIPIESIEE